MGDKILKALSDEILLEFPATDNVEFDAFKVERGYDKVTFSGIWK